MCTGDFTGEYDNLHSRSNISLIAAKSYSHRIRYTTTDADIREMRRVAPARSIHRRSTQRELLSSLSTRPPEGCRTQFGSKVD